MRGSFVVAAAGVALACAGCKPPATQLLVVVNTDTAINNPSDLHVRCAYDWDGISERTDLACDRPLVHRQADGGASMELPGTFRVLGDESRAGQPLTFVIDDQVDPTVNPSLIRVVRVVLPPHDPRRLTITLRANCEDVLPACFTCAPYTAPCTLSQYCVSQGMTCGDQGTCVSPDVPSSALAEDTDGGFDAQVTPIAPLDAACEGGGGADASVDVGGGPG